MDFNNNDTNSLLRPSNKKEIVSATYLVNDTIQELLFNLMLPHKAIALAAIDKLHIDIILEGFLTSLQEEVPNLIKVSKILKLDLDNMETTNILKKIAKNPSKYSNNIIILYSEGKANPFSYLDGSSKISLHENIETIIKNTNIKVIRIVTGGQPALISSNYNVIRVNEKEEITLLKKILEFKDKARGITIEIDDNVLNGFYYHIANLSKEDDNGEEDIRVEIAKIFGVNLISYQNKIDKKLIDDISNSVIDSSRLRGVGNIIFEDFAKAISDCNGINPLERDNTILAMFELNCQSKDITNYIEQLDEKIRRFI